MTPQNPTAEEKQTYRIIEFWDKIEQMESIAAECQLCRSVTFYQEKRNDKVIIRRLTPCSCRPPHNLIP